MMIADSVAPSADLPAGWHVKSLREISPRQSVGLVINPSTYFDPKGTVPMLVGSHVRENQISWANANRITEQANATLTASQLSVGDIVMVRVGDPGVTCVVPPELDGCNCASMVIIRRSDDFDSRWLSYLMNSPIGREQVEGVQYGTAQKQFNLSDAVDFRYPVPPLEEQRAIAEALSDVDALIHALDALIAKKRHIKQGTMQQLLTGKKRLPGFEQSTGEQKTELGTLPADWHLSTLGALCTFENGDRGVNYPSKDSFVSVGIPFVNAGHLGDGTISRSNMDYISAESFHRLGGGKISEGDVLFCLRGSLGKFGIVDASFGCGAIASSLIIIRPKHEQLRRGFFRCYLQSVYCERMIKQWAGGAAQPNLGGRDLANFTIATPPTLPEQDAIAAVLSDMDAEITALEQKRDKTKLIKQGMMQELLTGRTRLLVKNK